MEKKNKQMKNSSKSLKIKQKSLQVFIVIFSIIILILSLITLASTVKASDNLAFGRYRFYIMKAESHPDIAEPGDLVIAHKMEPGEIKAGDKIVYKDNEFYFCNNVIETKQTNIVNRIIIAEKAGIGYKFEEAEVSGKVVAKIHMLGHIITFLRTPLGIVFFAVFTLCIFALLRILLIRK